jgi:hypothetical protein
MKGAAVLVAVVLASCGSPTNTASRSPAPSATSRSTTSPPTVITPSSIPSGNQGLASAVQCTTIVPAGDDLVIGIVVGNPTVVVRDIQDPTNARSVCTFTDPNIEGVTFVSASTIAYVTLDGQIVEAPLAGGPPSIIATSGGGMSAGPYAVSPDGHSITYIDDTGNGNTTYGPLAWHLVTSSGNRVLTTLPAAPARGSNPDEDDRFLSFSPDGQYIAYFQTFSTGGSGETAPDEIRRASDGKLVYSTSGMTMAVWASVPSQLYFRDAMGSIHRWDPSAGLSAMGTLHWIRPKSSPDGRWIAYTFRTSTGLGSVGLYSVQSNRVENTTPPGRAEVFFLTDDLVWYRGERECTTLCGGSKIEPTGVTYVYSIAGTSEVTSRLDFIYDAWPHLTAPGL